jgi:gliding motility-associated-like protein
VVNAVTDATITPAGPFCLSDAATTLSAANTGGVWAGTGITNTANGTFDPATAGVGSHDITYTTAGSCPDTDTITIVVAAVLDATINPAGPFCISDAATTLTAANTGGVWAGTGITNTATGTFDPATAGIGTHEIVYTTSGSCSDSDTIQISVVNQLDATITPQSPVCDNEAAFNLTAANPGGTWTGTGITSSANGTFDPSVANQGTFTIVYTISGGCGDIDSIDVVVYEAPDISYNSVDESCTGAADGSIDLTISGGTVPYTYTWSPSGSTASLSGLLSGNYIVTVTDANGCFRNQTIVLGDPGIDCDGVIPHAVVPNAFSPNGDGENDMLYVLGEGVSMLNFIVYDRWGEKVFETMSLSAGWDGTFRGKELDPAVFSYYMNVTFVDGTSKIEKGDITLIR